jgi:hypothetical protein
MKLVKAMVLTLGLTYPTLALSQSAAPDPEFLQNALQALQVQRNNALDQAAAAEAKAASLAKANEKLTNELKELKAPKPDKKDK